MESVGHGKVAELLAIHGQLAGSYAALGTDAWNYSFYDTAHNPGVTSYLRTKRAAISWRGPVGPPGSEGNALSEFSKEVGPQTAQFIIGADETLAAAGTETGYEALWIGTECRTDLARWSLAGGRRRKLRWARNHAATTCAWREVFPLSDVRVRDEMLSVERNWKAVRKVRATDSFLRTDLRDQLDIRRHFACRDTSTGRIVAYVSALPVNSRAWYLQDCVRLANAVRGSLEGALALACETFSAEGYDYVASGILPMYSRDTGADLPKVGPIRKLIIRDLDRRYRFSGLNQFRMKLEPDESLPVYVLIKPARPSPLALRELVRALTKRLPAHAS